MCQEVREFYDKQYSADRMAVVIQVQTEDNLEEVRKWVTDAFSLIPNKELGPQDYNSLDGKA